MTDASTLPASADDDYDENDEEEKRSGEGFMYASDTSADDHDAPDKLEQQLAALEIQRAWRSHTKQPVSLHQLTQRTTETQTTSTGDSRLMQKTNTNRICCSCFQVMTSTEPKPSFDSTSKQNEDQQPYPQAPQDDEVEEDDEGELFCSACISILAKKPPSSLLPKWSVLVQTEAKYHDQLQLLRAQQERLHQQQEQLQARKRVQAEQVAAEKELSRQRRRHFQMIVERKKREEELKFQQFLAVETDRDNNTDIIQKPQTKKKQKKHVQPAVHLLKTIEKSPARSIASTNSHPVQLPDIEPKLILQNTLEQRKKQMQGCYAQDLTPLISGNKPKRLPVSTPSPIPASTFMKEQSKKKLDSKIIYQLSSNNERNNSPKKKKKMNGTLKLRPLQKSNEKKLSNQYEEEAEVWSSLIKPKTSFTSSMADKILTPEIKPVPWIYELGKGVLDEVTTTSSDNTVTQLQFMESQTWTRPMQLESVQEEDEVEQFMSKFRTQTNTRQQPVAITPPPTLVSNAAAAVDSVLLQKPEWEYSTERLSSLLEKYNVSVSFISDSK